MEKGKNYGYNSIETFAEKNQFAIDELGKNRVGESFLILDHWDKDIIISFVLIGATNNQYLYECIYSDL